ncbi:MAG: ATP-binding cassette domain-containing protein [Acetobacteraceae bacterium]|nr:ATP-binding cassette domain-containing protein [Acetobacteraceae bacterium]MDW8399941.1 ATP-binding cassette domain-containing protein [Acetobacteraceae bacterium]
MAHILAEDLSVAFPLYHIGARSLKKRLLGRASGRLSAGRGRVEVQALSGLTLAIRSGERVALIGPNGAGKTTLLRTLSGIYEPAAGRLEVAGEIGSLIDPSAGIEPFSTGRENIRLRGLFRGLKGEALAALEREAAALSGLGDFLDLPVGGYSTGMQVRLSFAIATSIRPQVLLMDEWIGAGDAEFRARAETRLAELVRDAEILVLATHDTTIIRRWCTRAIRLEAGRIVADGPVEALFEAETT